MPNLEPTVSLGCLFIDERNGYIGIGRNKKYNPKTCQWYKITDIRNPGLYCTKPRCDWHHKVMVDCEFVCDIPSQGIHIQRIVKQRIFCQHHPYAKDKHYEEWSEPGTISIMRGIIIQTYANAVQNEIKQWEDKLLCLNGLLYEQALCTFMLPNAFSQEILDERYKSLQQAFQGQTGCLMRIEKYYNLLKEHL